MGIIKYLGSLIKNDTGNSSKSFALVMSTIVSFLTSLVICGILVYDVYCNGFIKTDLEKAGIFMLCMGGYMAGSSVSKIFGDRARSRSKNWDDSDDEYMQRKRRKTMVAEVDEEEKMEDE